MRQRPRRLEETIKIVRQLWSRPNVSFQGRHFTLEDVSRTPRLLEGASIPILLGGSAEPAIRRAATLADGWIGSGPGTVEVFQQRLDSFRQFAREAGRDSEALETTKVL